MGSFRFEDPCSKICENCFINVEVHETEKVADEQTGNLAVKITPFFINTDATEVYYPFSCPTCQMPVKYPNNENTTNRLKSSSVYHIVPIYTIFMFIVAAVMFYRKPNLGYFLHVFFINFVAELVDDHFRLILKNKGLNQIWAPSIYGFVVMSIAEILIPLIVCTLLDTNGFENTGAVVIFHIAFFVLPLAAYNICSSQKWCDWGVTSNIITIFLWSTVVFVTVLYFDDTGKSLPYGSLILVSVIGFVFGSAFCALSKNNRFRIAVSDLTYYLVGGRHVCIHEFLLVHPGNIKQKGVDSFL